MQVWCACGQRAPVVMDHLDVFAAKEQPLTLAQQLEAQLSLQQPMPDKCSECGLNWRKNAIYVNYKNPYLIAVRVTFPLTFLFAEQRTQ